MEKSFSAGIARKKDYPQLMSMFEEIFGDSPVAVEHFFLKAVSEDNIICVRDGEKPVSMLYIIHCEIHLSGEFYKCAYIYAVGTLKEYRGMGCMRMAFDFLEKIARERGYSYLTLVPENDELFKMYEKLGFKNGLTANLVKCTASQVPLSPNIQKGCCSREHYKSKKIAGLRDVPVVILGEKGFDCFFSPAESGIFTLSSTEGYCIYEEMENKVIVYEVFGNKQAFIDWIFRETGKSEMYCYEPSKAGSKQFGMIKVLDDSPQIRNAFFGIPYGG